MAFVVVQHLSPGLQEPDGRAPRSPHRAADSPRRERDARRGRPRLPDPSEEGDDHLGRPAAAQRAGSRTRSCTLPDRRVLPLARAGLRRRARSPSCSRAAAATARAASCDVHEAGGLVIVAGRRERAVRRHAEDRARRRRRRLRPGARRRCRASSLEHVTPGDPELAGHGGSARDAIANGHRRRLPDAPGGVRHRLHPLQAEHGDAPDRAAARLARSPGHRRVRRSAEAERDELDVLYRDLLIGVTRFFRDEEAFEVLEEQVLPELLQRGPRDAPLRSWVAGCATGEEAYSLAILLPELIARSSASARSKSSRPTSTAARSSGAARHLRRRGGRERVARAPRALLHQTAATATRSCPRLRQMVVFAPHNVIKDAPFTRVDLVSCRNMLIYLQPPAQQKVLSAVSFRAEPRRRAVPRPEREPGRARRTTSRPSTSTGGSTANTATSGCPSTARFQPRPPSRGSSLAPAPVPPVARHSLSQLLGTYDALLERVHAAEPARQRRGRARPRVRRREAVPHIATAGGARRPRAWSTPSCGWCSSAACGAR